MSEGGPRPRAAWPPQSGEVARKLSARLKKVESPGKLWNFSVNSHHSIPTSSSVVNVDALLIIAGFILRMSPPRPNMQREKRGSRRGAAHATMAPPQPHRLRRRETTKKELMGGDEERGGPSRTGLFS